jgi:hypothetical protein
MKTKANTNSALSLGERVAGCGVFTSRSVTVRGLFLPISDGTNPSPVVLRLVKAPEADTLSPRERAGDASGSLLRFAGTKPECL